MTDKVMRPIRKEEYAYWDYNTDSEYEARKSSLKSEMIDEIDEISETNYPKFQARLKLDTLMDDIKTKHQEYHQFVTNKNMIEQEKKNKLDKAVDSMYEQLLKWNKERKWIEKKKKKRRWMIGILMVCRGSPREPQRFQHYCLLLRWRSYKMKFVLASEHCKIYHPWLPDAP